MASTQMRFLNKTAIVTGAGSGLGREVAEQLAAEGANVIALDLVFPDPDSGTPTTKEKERGKEGNENDVGTGTKETGTIQQRKLDVTDPAQWDALAQELDQGSEECGGGKVDILVNAAGVMDHGTLHETVPEEWRRVMAVDLDGVMFGMRAIIPLMRRQRATNVKTIADNEDGNEGKKEEEEEEDKGNGGGASRGGAVVNFSSTLATSVIPGAPAYHAAKAGVTQLTRHAALQYAADGIRVNAVHPGIVDTPLVRHQEAVVTDAAVGRTPLGRMASAREVARCVCFLLSDDAAFITGVALVIDGGFSLT